MRRRDNRFFSNMSRQKASTKRPSHPTFGWRTSGVDPTKVNLETSNKESEEGINLTLNALVIANWRRKLAEHPVKE